MVFHARTLLAAMHANIYACLLVDSQQNAADKTERNQLDSIGSSTPSDVVLNRSVSKSQLSP